MNNWKKIWNQRDIQIDSTEDVFDMFCKLKSADGYDTQLKEGYYESFFEEWKCVNNEIHKNISDFDSVYEVGCGSGVNLYLYQKLLGFERLGGIDYSKPLLHLAQQTCVGEKIDFKNGEAIDMEILPQYDIVLSEVAFIYFPDMQYGMEVLAKMYEKAKKAVIVKEIFDLSKKETCMNARRASVKDYDKRYKNLDKTFYSKEIFYTFAEEKGCRYKIVQPNNKCYWNNDFVFDFYLYK